MADPRRLLAAPVLALCWLTRLPVGRFLPDPAPQLQSALWAFPLAGMVVGGAGALVLGLALWLGLTLLIAALLAVAAQIWLTGGLHEDGLADLADGMGGATRDRRLEIMRDSRIGSYGVLALGLTSALRVAALAALPPVSAMIALVALGALSRAGIVAALRWLEPARGDGLGRGAGRPPAGVVAAAICLGLMPFFAASVCPVAFPPLAGMIAVLGCFCGQILIGIKAKRALGGQTGDVLGAVQQIGEVSALVALAAILVEKA
ncbi:adenosylcobinamide-GDP ribazoletransferase [Paracoccus sp. DMF-8]|uniref:adenosylcobinamide-GDP ribazoletransferase n=1 Tax=Paracoccus sp. DMF-8 TaxID=3019445 RepID=UPI0023E791A6|nr:adenosylcobinamide-GDP ribazoletransferase [Paracoccus sp. DMF-8]MDF3605491.1 adenosylcobinamide-GDP ribazoletransferase [Paracoccus sp. DMF-8]